MDTWTDGMINRYIGSWIRVSPDGEYWGEPFQAPVNTPHGFIVLKDGGVTEAGKPEDLLKQNGEFAKMVRLQQQSAGWTVG